MNEQDVIDLGNVLARMRLTLDGKTPTETAGLIAKQLNQMQARRVELPLAMREVDEPHDN